LMNKKGLDRYPSVYNALYCWSKLGWSNHIITSGTTDEFRNLIEKEYQFRGGYVRRAAQLAYLDGYFDLVIVYDPQDLEAFYATRWLFPRNSYGTLVHHCLEIPTGVVAGRSPYTNGLHKILGGAYRLIDHLILQDDRRAELFFKTFPYLKGRPCHLVTNSFINAIEPVSPSLAWFDELRAQSQLLVLYTGTIERWAFSENLFDRLLHIKEVTFLFSGWSQDGYAETLAAQYRTATNIHFHMGAKSRADLNYMVANADVGLVCYESADPNVCQVGLSSGKMHKFLSFQKPVLTNGITSLHDFITHNGFGLSVAIDDFPMAVRQMAEHYPTFCENIRTRYSVLCNYEQEYRAFEQALLNWAQDPDDDRRFEEVRTY
jgi:glycosyltransferase involved in cell wall biosynthesis